MDRDTWAEEKVRNYFPQCKEKATLRAIAHYASRGGDGVWCSIDTIAYDTGQSSRTVRRHVRALVMRGELVTWCDRKRARDTNFYFIPLCTETPAELEERTGISAKQMKLPIVQRDHAGGVPACVPKRPWGRVGVSYPQGQNDPQEQIHRTEPMNIKKAVIKKSSQDEDRDLGGPISDETRSLIADTLAKLKVEPQDYLVPTLPGTRLREAIYGERVSEVGLDGNR